MKTEFNINKAAKGQIREEFMEAGGNDGRFRQRTVKSKKSYSRKGRSKDKGYLGDQY